MVKQKLTLVLILTLLFQLSSVDTSSGINMTLTPKFSQFKDEAIKDAGIHVNNFPVGIAVNPSSDKLYVTNEYSNTVSVINGRNDTIENTIRVGGLPYDVDVDPFTNRIYVANLGTNSISVIDGETNHVIAEILNVYKPVGLDVDYNNSWIYVTNIDNNTISRIDAVTNKVDKVLHVGENPYTVDIKSGREQKIYVTNIRSNTVSVVEGTSFTLLRNIAVGEFPVGLAANPRTNLLYVANRESNSVSIINTTSDVLLKNLIVGTNPDGVDINFDTNMVYVTNTGSSSVSVIDGKKNEVIKNIRVNTNISPELIGFEVLPPTIKFPNVASFVDVNPRTNMVYVTNTGSSSVSVIDGKTNSLLVGMDFKMNPSNSGRIECNDVLNKKGIANFNENNYTRIPYGKELRCIFFPNANFAFDYWSGDILKNAIIDPRLTTTLGSIISWFGGLFFPQQSASIRFSASEYDKIVLAIAKPGPDYIPVLILPIIFTSIPFIIHGLRLASRKLNNKLNEGNYLHRHTKIMDDAFNSSSRSEIEAHERLTQIRNDILHDYYRGSINDRNYEILITKIADQLEILRARLTLKGAPIKETKEE